MTAREELLADAADLDDTDERAVRATVDIRQTHLTDLRRDA